MVTGDSALEAIAHGEATLKEEADNQLVQIGLQLAKETLPNSNAALPPRLRIDHADRLRKLMSDVDRPEMLDGSASG